MGEENLDEESTAVVRHSAQFDQYGTVSGLT